MTLSEAIAAIQSGHRVRASGGSVFWLEQDTKGRQVLMGQPPAIDHPVKNIVFSSEHFRKNLVWTVED